jgi:hypothetical protein
VFPTRHKRLIVGVILCTALGAFAFNLVTRASPLIRGNSPGKRAPRIHRVGSPIPTPVQVFVSIGTRGSRTEYRYRLANGSAFPIRALSVGYDIATGSQLTAPPGGWDVEMDPDTTYATPTGWAYQFVTVEGESLGNAAWSAGNNAYVGGGQTLSGFSLVPGGATPEYEHSRWTAYTTSSEQRFYTGDLQPEQVSGVQGGTSLDRNPGIRVSPSPGTGPFGIKFGLPSGTVYEVIIYDVQGRRVRKLVEARSRETTTSLSWNGRDARGSPVASGIYFVRLKTPNEERFARIVVTR